MKSHRISLPPSGWSVYFFKLFYDRRALISLSPVLYQYNWYKISATMM
jgi:hypothetical protein